MNRKRRRRDVAEDKCIITCLYDVTLMADFMFMFNF